MDIKTIILSFITEVNQLNIVDNNKATLIGLSIKNLIEKNFTLSKKSIYSINLSDVNNKVKIVINLQSSFEHKIELVFNKKNVSRILFTMKLDDKGIRKDALLDTFDDSLLAKFFSKLDRSIHILTDKFNIDNVDFSFKKHTELTELFDAVAKLIIK